MTSRVGRKIDTTYFKGVYARYAKWFRVFGYGLLFLKISEYPALFSERTGHTTWYYAFGWKFRFLRRDEDYARRNHKAPQS